MQSGNGTNPEVGLSNPCLEFIDPLVSIRRKTSYEWWLLTIVVLLYLSMDWESAKNVSFKWAGEQGGSLYYLHTHINFSSEYCPSLTTLFRRPPHQAGKALGSAPGGPTSTDRFRFHRNLASKVLAWLPFFDSFEITIVVVLDDSLDQSDGAKAGSKTN